MIARLEHLLDSQRRLLADTSHELRNPITIIRGNLALLRRDGRAPKTARREAIVEAEDEAARMGRLVGDLLLLARADAGELPSLQSRAGRSGRAGARSRRAGSTGRVARVA